MRVQLKTGVGAGVMAALAFAGLVGSPSGVLAQDLSPDAVVATDHATPPRDAARIFERKSCGIAQRYSTYHRRCVWLWPGAGAKLD